MSEQLDAPTGDSPPSLYLPNVGDAAVLGIVDVAEYQQRDYDTGEPVSWPDGGPKMGKRITGMIVSLKGDACGGGQRNQVTVDVGDLVTIWAEGGKFLSYSRATKDAGGVFIGDVMLWERTPDGEPSNPRHNPPKTYKAKIRRPDPAKDGDVLERCSKARTELKSERLDHAPAGGPVEPDDMF